MKIDGKAIAQQILDKLTHRVTALKEEGITPHLAVVLIGNDESSKAYVRQKELKIHQIGGAVSIHRFGQEFTQDQLLTLIQELNDDPIVHGIIIQRPLPTHIDGTLITNSTVSEKDVDGFRDDSPFDPPIARAVFRILREIHAQEDDLNQSRDEWLKTKKIVILGKGVTAGQPIIKLFHKRQIPLAIVDSKTENREELIRGADIIISAVGKPQVIQAKDINETTTLIGVGMFRGDDGKLHGDYEEEEVAEKAQYYTSVPGGVGPVNVAMLLTNLVEAAETQ